MTNNIDHLNDIVEGLKKSLNSEDSDYVTVFITVLIGEKEGVIVAEEIIRDVDLDEFPCKSARVKMAGWKGKKDAGA